MFSNRRIISLIAILCIVLAVPITLFLNQHRQEYRQHAASANPIQHIVFMVKENRTFDNYFGTFPGANGATTFTGSDGKKHQLVHQPDALVGDINHEPNYAHQAYDNGKMDMFSKTPGAIQNINGVQTDEADSQVYQSDIPNYWQYAQHFTLLDNYFSTIMGPSFANHLTTIAGFTDNVDGNPMGNIRNTWGCDSINKNDTVEERLPDGTTKQVLPCFDNFQTLADILDAKGTNWKYYAPSFGVRGYGWSVYNAIKHIRYGSDWQNNVMDYTTFANDAAAGKLPAVTWLVEDSADSDHPPFSICQGENWTVQQINAIMQNQSLWNSTAIVLTWDDWGGFYDHVVPPNPPQGNPNISYGFRAPAIIISAYSKASTIDSTLYSHESMLAFAEKIFNLPSLGGLDATADPFSNAFNFTQQPLPPLILQQRNCSGTPTPTPTASVTSTPTPTPLASITPSDTPSPTPTTIPSLTPTVTPTPANTTQLALTIGLHDIGYGGDNPNPKSQGNLTPQHQNRPITLVLADLKGNIVATVDGQVSYNPTNSAEPNVAGLFTGLIPLPPIPNGGYFIKIKSDGYLEKQIPNIVQIQNNQLQTVPLTYLVNGDITNDNALDIQDYNALIECYGNPQINPNYNCQYPITQQSQGADIDDDGVVDGIDYNAFLRELSVQQGQ